MNKIKRVIAICLAVILVVGLLPVSTEASTVKLNKSKVTIYVGESVTLKLKGTSKQVRWGTTRASVANVTKNGKVTARKKGTATIVARVGKKAYKCNVTVKNPYLNSTKKTLKIGEKYKLKITGTKAKAWTSSKKAVAVVSKNGEVSALRVGTSTITCKGKNGKSYKCKITVEPKETKLQVSETEAQAYSAMIALQASYPTGTPWTNANFYRWNGGIYYGGYGCAGFVFMLSDAAFGKLPARKHTDFNNIKVGDILRIDNDTHSVIVLERHSDGYVVAEGNFDGMIYWGRKLSTYYISTMGTYVMTRYP